MRVLILNETLALAFGKDGYFLVHRKDIYIGKSIELYGEHGGIEVEFLQSLVRPGDHVVEVGANIGSHTIGLANAIGPAGKIISFEPQRACYALLQAQIALNQARNIFAFNEAVGKARGKLWVPKTNYAEPGNFGAVELSNEETAGAEQVDVVTLDERLGDIPCALLKIDVEGMEADVIAGAIGLIKNQHPLLYVENDRVENSETLVSLLLDLGYRVWWHITRLYNPKNFFGAHENIYRNIATYNLFCCHGYHEAATDLVEVKSPDDPYPHAGF